MLLDVVRNVVVGVVKLVNVEEEVSVSCVDVVLVVDVVPPVVTPVPWSVVEHDVLKSVCVASVSVSRMVICTGTCSVLTEPIVKKNAAEESEKWVRTDKNKRYQN